MPSDEDTEGMVDGKDHGYDYLLSMSFWSLTHERVQQLEKEMLQKRQELDLLLGKSADDLWNADIDEFLESWMASLKNI